MVNGQAGDFRVCHIHVLKPVRVDLEREAECGHTLLSGDIAWIPDYYQSRLLFR